MNRRKDRKMPRASLPRASLCHALLYATRFFMPRASLPPSLAPSPLPLLPLPLGDTKRRKRNYNCAEVHVRPYHKRKYGRATVHVRRIQACTSLSTLAGMVKKNRPSANARNNALQMGKQKVESTIPNLATRYHFPSFSRVCKRRDDF